MRLYQEQAKVLKDKLKTISSTAQLYLFGSRVDDEKKGGDIDLLVVSKEITKKDLRYLRIEFFKHFGEQKLDIILDDGEFKNPFTKHIIKKAVLDKIKQDKKLLEKQLFWVETSFNECKIIGIKSEYSVEEFETLCSRYSRFFNTKNI